jgi:hypothetical protein
MNASPTATTSDPMLGVLRALLLSEAIGGLVLTIFLSMLAAGVGSSPVAGPDETTIRFAAGGAFLFAIFAAFASRGVRRRRASAWTTTAVLQVLLAIGTGIGILSAEWHPLFLVGFALPALAMLALSTTAVRSALGQT